MMVDPDSPNPARPHLQQTEHFMIINIPDSDIAKGDVLAGELAA